MIRDARVAVKERPILFSGPLVRQLLAGRKTQTRRVVKLPHQRFGVHQNGYRFEFTPVDEHGAPTYESGRMWEPSPFGRVGDRLWVRETFFVNHYKLETGPFPKSMPDEIAHAPEQYICYRATNDPRSWEAESPDDDGTGRSCWRPSIYMPRWASRIDLEVTGVCVERLHEITEDNARAEGVEVSEGVTAIEAFRLLWDSINGKRKGCGWADDPFVWVVSFKEAR